MLSVICPIYNEEKYIAQFLDSLLQQDYPKDDLEILLVDGMSKDRTREIVAGYTARYPFIRLIDNPEKIVPYAMNRGIGEAKGDVIMRLDAHASYQPDYFSVLVAGLRRLRAENVGTVCRTDVLNKTAKTLAIREVLGNRFGVGNSTFRTGITEEQEVDTVPFGCWPREVFTQYGKYDVRLVRNQDIELNKRIKRGGGKIYILPETYCTYLARETWAALAKNNYGNGKWNILTVWYTRVFSSLSIRHFIPLLFVLSLIVPTLLALLWWPFILVSALSLLAYTALVSAISLRLALQKGLNFFYLVATFFVLHLSYGWGSLCGLLALLVKSRQEMGGVIYDHHAIWIIYDRFFSEPDGAAIDEDLVSIITPTYNCGRYIAETISSVQAQTYKHWEMLVVDDCSTDDTEAVVASFHDPRIHYLCNTRNSGAALSRNRALREARGRWIAFLDGDDTWRPEKLETQIRFMTTHNYACTYTEYTEMDADSRLLGKRVTGPRRIGYYGMYAFCWPGCLTVMYDAQQVGLVQIVDIKKNNDYAMWLQVIRKADFHLLPQTLADYRRREGSISNHGYTTLLRWHYLLFREADGRNIVAATCLTLCNMAFGVVKKLIYVKRNR